MMGIPARWKTTMAKKRKSSSRPAPRSPCSRYQTRPDPISSPAHDTIARTPFSAGASTAVQSLNSVFLSDWWLRRVQGKGLSVAGFEAKGGSGVRLFSSGAISKRHDSTTLETVEGITVSISGLINRLRTLQNGFSFEVCSHFLMGFPWYWEHYATLSCGQEETGEKHDQTNEGRPASLKGESASCSTVSFDDIPVNRFYELLMSPPNHSKDCLGNKALDEVLGRLRHCISQGSPVKEQSDKRFETSADSINSEAGEEEEGADHDKKMATGMGVKTRGMMRLRRTIKEEGDLPFGCAPGKRFQNARYMASVEARNASRNSSVEKNGQSLSSKASSAYDDYSELTI
ncbi:PREDICTED: protein EMBRYO DEFECTIVE 1674 [Tarenaya hassleriana]|uniref:protein EMBRYO DEFECTIVE 1674 n=1 Tax=Tarenaya hassleriana TaxID=28532 RepID=UPI00053C125E|nr:PREDICTED: protein EMBRYO DEFECTIVE 1674 [Tarenaya hassleriana]